MTAEQENGRDTPIDGATVPAEAVLRLIHDVNGLLSPIVGFAELLASGSLPEEKRPIALRAIAQAGADLQARLRLATAEFITCR